MKSATRDPFGIFPPEGGLWGGMGSPDDLIGSIQDKIDSEWDKGMSIHMQPLGRNDLIAFPSLQLLDSFESGGRAGQLPQFLSGKDSGCSRSVPCLIFPCGYSLRCTCLASYSACLVYTGMFFAFGFFDA